MKITDCWYAATCNLVEADWRLRRVTNSVIMTGLTPTVNVKWLRRKVSLYILIDSVSVWRNWEKWRKRRCLGWDSYRAHSEYCASLLPQFVSHLICINVKHITFRTYCTVQSRSFSHFKMVDVQTSEVHANLAPVNVGQRRWSLESSGM
jgi:hypothetical protein